MAVSSTAGENKTSGDLILIKACPSTSCKQKWQAKEFFGTLSLLDGIPPQQSTTTTLGCHWCPNYMSLRVRTKGPDLPAFLEIPRKSQLHKPHRCSRMKNTLVLPPLPSVKNRRTFQSWVPLGTYNFHLYFASSAIHAVLLIISAVVQTRMPFCRMASATLAVFSSKTDFEQSVKTQTVRIPGTSSAAYAVALTQKSMHSPTTHTVSTFQSCSRAARGVLLMPLPKQE